MAWRVESVAALLDWIRSFPSSVYTTPRASASHILQGPGITQQSPQIKNGIVNSNTLGGQYITWISRTKRLAHFLWKNHILSQRLLRVANSVVTGCESK